MVSFGRVQRYNYLHCYDISKERLRAPPPPEARPRRGDCNTCCNGDYLWRAYSDGSDLEALQRDQREDVTILPKDRMFQSISGSNGLYSFTADHPYLPEVRGQFVSCHCRFHQELKQPELCPYKEIIFANMPPNGQSDRGPGLSSSFHSTKPNAVSRRRRRVDEDEHQARRRRAH